MMDVKRYVDVPKEMGDVTTEPNGFPNRTDSTMSFDDGTRTFTIQPTSSYFEFYSLGKKFKKTSADTVTITDTDGLWFIYYTTAGVLTSSQTPWSFGVGTVFVAIVYWDATAKAEISGIGEERHGIIMDSATHAYFHNNFGAQWNSGYTPSVTVDGDGSLDAHAEMQSISAGVTYDEDIVHNNAEQTTYEMWYKTGASGIWRMDAASAAAVAVTTTRPDYNEWTGATWQRTEVSNTKFTLTHIFATNRIAAAEKIIFVMGENEYNSKQDAQDGAETEIAAITAGDLPTPEFARIATVIVECKDAYTNTYNARLVSTADGADFVDFRESEKTGVGGSTNHHGNLSGLLEDDHTQYLLASAATDRATFATNWTDLTDAGDTSLHTHTKTVEIALLADSTALATGDDFGDLKFVVPSVLNGWNLTAAHATVATASSSGLPNFQINNLDYSGGAQDMLSTAITIDANELTSYTATTAPVINTTYDDVSTGDRLRFDCDTAGTGTAGAKIILTFTKP